MNKKKILICNYCDKKFERYICWIKKAKSKHVFCSRNCKAKWQEIYLKNKNNPNFGNHILSKKFIGIKNPFYGKHHTQKTIQKIKQQISGKKHYNWQGGKSLEEYGAEFDNALKEQVRFRDGYKCQICGCSQLENGRQLDCHHIDYNKKNNILNNLIALCIKCHRKTNHNRKSWQEYFTKPIGGKMFKCSECNGISKPNERMNKVVVEKRPRTYHTITLYRKRSNSTKILYEENDELIEKLKKDGWKVKEKSKTEGWEIEKESQLCGECHAKKI